MQQIAYDLGASVYIPSGQDPNGVAIFAFYEFPNLTCTGGYTGSQMLVTRTPGVWTQLTTSMTPASTTQALFIVIGVGAGSHPPFAANFDDVYVRPH